MERDLFGSILCLALKRKINIEEFLTDFLTAIPLNLCHIDGKMSKSTKKWLMWLSLKKWFSPSPLQFT